MKRIDRYLIQEFLKILSLVLIGMNGVYLIVDFFEKVDDFTQARARVVPILLYFLYKLPLINFQLFPFALLLTTITTLGLLSKSNELIALRSFGMSLHRATSPFVLLALVASGLSFLMNEYLLPLSNQRATTLLEVEIQHRPRKGVFRQERIWFLAEDNSIWNIKYYDVQRNRMQGVTIYRFDREQRLKERQDAETADWLGSRWQLRSGYIRRFDHNGSFTVVPFQQLPIAITEKPEDFKRVQKTPEEMNLREIRQFVAKMRRSGFDVARYVVAMHEKVAYPAVSLIMVLIGIVCPLRSRRATGIAPAIALGILIGFGYHLIHGLGMSMGFAGRLPPLPAAWLANLLFLGGGGILWMRHELYRQ